MTLEEAKTAYYSEAPVIHDEIEYERISALIYRKPKGQPPRVELELLDKCGHSITIASLHRTKLKEANNEIQSRGRSVYNCNIK